ncbi:MAG: hypothetical protein JXR96_26410, partial [Deltaproteobacteria bacterium]|nr:hypothetical protein [Deltaproteobacteria bacterium]
MAVFGCRDQVEQKGLTGVQLTVELNGHTVDQLLISGTVDRDLAFDPGTVPEAPRQLGPEPESVTVLLATRLVGKTVLMRADGLLRGTRVASGAGAIEVQRERLVPLTITLGEVAVCGDGQVAAGIEECDDEDLDDGDGCSALCLIEEGYDCDDSEPSRCERICDGTTCPDGCCDGSRCRTRTFSTCGISGSDCVACNTATADNCSADGECVCGMQDRACSYGQRCVGGGCICDIYSCDGCCDGVDCLGGTEQTKCGAGGKACEDCSPY